MKRKAVVKLLAGTLCTATMAGSILPDAAVAYAEGEQQTETVMETEREETKQSEEKADAEQPEEKPEGTENRENITDPVDNREEAGKNPAAKDTENDIPDTGTVQEDTNVPQKEETEETKKEEETVTPEETPKEETEETPSLKEESTKKKEKEETSKKEKDRDKEDVPEVEIPEEVESNGASTVTVGNETDLRNAINGHNGGITIYLKNKIEVNSSIIIRKNNNGKAKQVTICSNEAGKNRRICLGERMRNKADSDIFKVGDGCTLTFGNNNGGVIQVDGRNKNNTDSIPHGGSLVKVEVGGTVNMYGTMLTNNKNQDGHGSGLSNNGTAYLESVQVLNNCFNPESQYFKKCTNTFGDEKYCVGGGLKNSGIMTVVSCTITGNQATCGGGIYTSGSMQNGGYAYTVIRGTTDISGNQVHNYGGINCARGGGIAVAPKTSETVNCGVLAVYADNGVTSIHGNTSEGSAAGVYNNGLCNLYSTQIYENTAAEHAAVWNGGLNGNIVNSIDNVGKAQGSMCMNSVNIYGNISNTTGKAAVTNNGDMEILGGFIHDNNRIGVSNNGHLSLANAGNNYTQIYLNGRWGQENTGGIRNKGTLDIYYASVYSNSGHGITNSGTLNVISGCTGYVSYNTRTGICNNVGATLNIAGSAGISNNGMSGILNSGMMDVSGNLSVEGSQIGLDNTGTAYLRSYGSIKSSGACAVQNVGNAVISGSPEIKSDAAWSVYNLGMMEVSGQPTILGKRPVLNRGTFTNSSKINYGNVEGDTAIRHEAGVLNIAGNSSQDASHDIFLNPMQYATIYGALSRRNILAPSEYELGRKVAEVTYVENSHTVAENSLELKDTSTGFVLCGCSKINLTEANKKVRGGLNGAALKANDVILSKKYNVTYNSGLPDEINCTMPENRTVYWCEDVALGGKPQISDKANRYVYQFLGWYDEDGKEYQEGDRICVDGNLVLTAKWEMSCNIAYHGNGQTIGDDYTQEKDKSLIISDTEMYKFDGKSYKGLVGEDTFQRTETYKKDENGNLLNENNKTVTDERRAAKLTSLNPDTGKEEPCEEQYSVKEWGTSANVLKKNTADETFELNTEYRTSVVYQSALNTTNDKGENLCITYDAPDDMVKKGREEKPADKLTLGVKKQDAAIYGASQGKMTSGTWLNMYAVWDKFPQLDAYNRYFTLKQAENGEITTEALLTTLRFKDEEDTDGKYLYSKDYEYNKKENCLIIKGKDGATLKLRAETDMDSLKETGKSTIRYTLTDSAGNITTKEVECRIVDTSDIPKEYDTYVRFISPKYYKKNGAYVSKENGGLEEHSIWKTDPEYAALLDKAMSNEKRGIQKKSVRVFGVKFEADDPGSGTWDHVEETWEFTHEQVRSVDDFVDEHGYMNYKEKDGLKKFREQYKDCIK